MAVVSKLLGATLRVTDADDAHMTSLRNIAPGINGQRANAFLNACASIRGVASGNAFLTVTTELSED